MRRMGCHHPFEEQVVGGKTEYGEQDKVHF
jgi:hypothetical protein